MLVVLAMCAALVFRGGELLVSEAAVSAILLATLEPVSSTYSADRVLEALIGGGVGLAVASLLLPPDPVALASQSAQSVFGALGRTLEETAAALRTGDARRAESAETAARALDEHVEALEDALSVATETARFAPIRRAGRATVHRYQPTLPQLDFAARNARVLARYAARQVRSGARAPLLSPGPSASSPTPSGCCAPQYERPERRERRTRARARRGPRGRGDPRPRAVAADDADRRAGAIRRRRHDARLRDPERRPRRAGVDLPTEELLLSR